LTLCVELDVAEVEHRLAHAAHLAFVEREVEARRTSNHEDTLAGLKRRGVRGEQGPRRFSAHAQPDQTQIQEWVGLLHQTKRSATVDGGDLNRRPRPAQHMVVCKDEVGCDEETGAGLLAAAKGHNRRKGSAGAIGALRLGRRSRSRRR